MIRSQAMENDKVQLDWREFNQAVARLRKAWEDVERVWRDYRRLLKERAMTREKPAP